MAKRKSYKPQVVAAEQTAVPGEAQVPAGEGLAEAAENGERPRKPVKSYKPQARASAGTGVAKGRRQKPVKSYKPQARASADAGVADARGAGVAKGRLPKPVKSYKPGVAGASARRRSVAKVRRAIPALVLLVCAVAFVAAVPLGNVSAFGWDAIAAICPMGALSTLVASKTLVPRALVSLAVAAVLVLLFGRAFCSWVCSVPLVERLLGVRDGDREGGARARGAAGRPDGCRGACAGCAKARGRALDTRHWVLGGSLLSAALFGFPVFCLVCPIGLTFATIYLVLRLFSGSVTWALVVVPALLVVELLLARRWCHNFCPLGALMSLVARGNRTFVPAIDRGSCLESTRGVSCGRCHKACPEGIDLRDLLTSPVALNECVKCRACVEACPAHAISMPLVPGRVSPALAPNEPCEVTAAAPNEVVANDVKNGR